MNEQNHGTLKDWIANDGQGYGGEVNPRPLPVYFTTLMDGQAIIGNEVTTCFTQNMDLKNHVGAP